MHARHKEGISDDTSSILLACTHTLAAEWQRRGLSTSRRPAVWYDGCIVMKLNRQIYINVSQRLSAATAAATALIPVIL